MTRPAWVPALGLALVAAAAALLYVAVLSPEQPPRFDTAEKMVPAAPTVIAKRPSVPQSAAKAPFESLLGLPLVSSATRLITRVRALGDEDDPLERELDAWRADGLRGLHSIRNLGHGKSL